MATNESFFNGFQLNRPLLAGGAVLTGIGAVLSVAGTVMVCAALATAGRNWMRSMDTPPSALAQKAIHDAKVASAAGWEAWRSEHAASPN
ncbi:hypothetical protein [Streptomyces sp. CB01881]|uniref:hypothetical protein n=1 Tax=Streptomyces sp. CB01881 TaxID=2078691 RepID=UPI000CDBEE68|nr:hypothetical protein [Streptomyces sp. CB01881]AUY51088.1 hypothetical protein C2142_21510 [Streptomyces sp. CB01881]TYC74471.1 hypothetical protein EH183_21480 [Streptomyces sp. CB01881]